MPKPTDRVSDADTYRKILAFATSAGQTITNRDALEVIRSLCRERLGLSKPVDGAIARHAERVRDALEEVPHG